MESIAADANVILAAVTGNAALKVFTRSTVRVVTTEKTLIEVREYLPEMAEYYSLPPEISEAQTGLLALTVCREEAYTRRLKEARKRPGKRISKRDLDDVDLLALALTLNVSVWSNDNDFPGGRVKWYTTAQLLKALGIR